MKFGWNHRAMNFGWFKSVIKLILNPIIYATGPIPNELYQPVGTLLYCTTGIWRPFGLTYLYQWRSNGVNIVGATSFSYTIVSGDIGDTIDCVVSIQGTDLFAESSNVIYAIAAPNFFVDTTLTKVDSTVITSDKY